MKKNLPKSFTVTLTDADYQKAIRELESGAKMRSQCCLVSQAVKRELGATRVSTNHEGAYVGDVWYVDGKALDEAVNWFDEKTPLIKLGNWPKVLPKSQQKRLTFRLEKDPATICADPDDEEAST